LPQENPIDIMAKLRQCAINLALMPEYPMVDFNLLARLGTRVPGMTDKKMKCLLHPDKNGNSEQSTHAAQMYAGYKDRSTVTSVACRGVFKNLKWRFQEEVDFVNASLAVLGKAEDFAAPPPPAAEPQNPQRPLAAASAPKDDDGMEVVKLTVNVKFMKWFMCTQAAQDLKWGCQTYSKVLGHLIDMCRDETPDGLGTLLVAIHEPKNPLGLRGRLVTGGAFAHPLLKREANLSSSKGLVGFANFPKIIRACLTVGVPGTFDLDLENAHMQALKLRHPVEPFPLVDAYLLDKAAERLRLAVSMQVHPTDIKELMVSALYMSKDSWWLDLHSKDEFSPEVEAFMSELATACKLDGEKQPQLVELLLQNRKFLNHHDPMASLFAYLNLDTEQTFFDSLNAEVQIQRGQLKIPLGDGGIFQGSRIKPEVIIDRLRQKNISVSVKELPMTEDAFKQFVRAVCDAKKDPVEFPVPDSTTSPGVLEIQLSPQRKTRAAVVLVYRPWGREQPTSSAPPPSIKVT
jgi:hypothetical protein